MKVAESHIVKYIQTSEVPEKCTDPLIKDMDHALQMARNNEEWRNDYMTLELMKQEKFEEGKEEGRRETAALFEQIFTKAEIQGIKVDYSRLQDSAYMNELCQKLNIIQ